LGAKKSSLIIYGPENAKMGIFYNVGSGGSLLKVVSYSVV
jgi:hypothetical protein